MAKKRKQNPDHKWIVGTWYTNPMSYLVNYQRGNHAYGFQNGWKDNWRIVPSALEDQMYIEATSTDVGSSLIEEAKKRGYKNGVKYKEIYQKAERTLQGVSFVYEFDMASNTLTMENSGGSYLIFASGKWAEIVSTNNTTTELYKVGDIFEVPIGTQYRITNFDANYIRYAKLDGTNKQEFTRDVVDPNFQKGSWKIVNQESLEKPKIEIGQVYKKDDGNLYRINELSTDTIWFYDFDGNLLDASRGNIESAIKYGIWVLQTDEYANNTQEELKTLLKAYTILADKGNEEAKKEILILQKLIK